MKKKPGKRKRRTDQRVVPEPFEAADDPHYRALRGELSAPGRGQVASSRREATKFWELGREERKAWFQREQCPDYDGRDGGNAIRAWMVESAKRGAIHIDANESERRLEMIEQVSNGDWKLRVPDELSDELVGPADVHDLPTRRAFLVRLCDLADLAAECERAGANVKDWARIVALAHTAVGASQSVGPHPPGQYSGAEARDMIHMLEISIRAFDESTAVRGEQESELQRRFRIPDGREAVEIDGRRFEVNSGQKETLKVLLDADGERRTSKQLGVSEVREHLSSLPPEVLAWIRSRNGPGGGYRLVDPEVGVDGWPKPGE